jgi:hypothetical protein
VNAQSKVEAATLSSAMALAFAEIEAATKSAENAAFKQGGKASKYANINAVIEAIKPALIKHQLFFTQHPQPSERGVTVETVLHHAGGEHLSLGALYVPANKLDPHGFGSALTYARRYALVTAFGVPVEDDDGNKAVETMNSPRADPAPLDRPTLITEQQFRALQDYADAKVIDLQRFCAFFQIPSLKALPAYRFDEAKAMAEAKKQKVKA